jgi:hypothetical protein
MPEDLKAAMRGRARLYRGEVVDVVDLAAEAATEAPVAESSGGGSAPAKRSRRSVSRPPPLPRVRPRPARTDPAPVLTGVCYPGPGL